MKVARWRLSMEWLICEDLHAFAPSTEPVQERSHIQDCLVLK